MSRNMKAILLVCLCSLPAYIQSFHIAPALQVSCHALDMASTSGPQQRMSELTEPEQVVYEIMKQVSDSGYSFRIVVVGKGAILETTPSSLGPVIKVSQSPATGDTLMTFASEDQSFEYHMQLAKVSKIVFVEKETPAKTMRIIRLLNETGDSMSSLILVDKSDEAIRWYHELVASLGNEIQL